MDGTEVTFAGLVVVTLVGAVRDVYPQITGNLTRLLALVFGALIGVIAQYGLLPGVDLNVVTGIMAGVAAVGAVTVADRVGRSSAGRFVKP